MIIFYIHLLTVNANRVTATSRDGWKKQDEGENEFVYFIMNNMFNRRYDWTKDFHFTTYSIYDHYVSFNR